MALGRENRRNRFQVILAKIRPPFSPFLAQKALFGPKMGKNQYYANFIMWPIIFHVQGAKKSKKIFSGHFDQIGSQIWAKKDHFGSKFSKKMKFFKKKIFFDLNDSESKEGQKNDENFFPY